MLAPRCACGLRAAGSFFPAFLTFHFQQGLALLGYHLPRSYQVREKMEESMKLSRYLWAVSCLGTTDGL